MHLKELLKSGCAYMVAAAMMLQPVAMAAQNAQNVVVLRRRRVPHTLGGAPITGSVKNCSLRPLRGPMARPRGCITAPVP